MSERVVCPYTVITNVKHAYKSMQCTGQLQRGEQQMRNDGW